MQYEASEGGILLPKIPGLILGGHFDIDHVREGEVIDSWREDNLVVNEGLDAVLNIMFHGTTQISTWYVGLFEGNYTPVAGVTAATITAASTECTAYDEATRQEYVEAAASGQSITNFASRATFTFNATKTIYGLFLVSASAKSATSGTLFSAARFGSSKAVVDDDQLLVTYTLGAASA
jgi:hypothetical protein